MKLSYRSLNPKLICNSLSLSLRRFLRRRLTFRCATKLLSKTQIRRRPRIDILTPSAALVLPLPILALVLDVISEAVAAARKEGGVTSEAAVEVAVRAERGAKDEAVAAAPTRERRAPTEGMMSERSPSSESRVVLIRARSATLDLLTTSRRWIWKKVRLSKMVRLHLTVFLQFLLWCARGV